MIRAVTFDWWHTIAEPHRDDPVQGDLRSWEAFAKEARLQGIAAVFREHGVAGAGDLGAAYDAWGAALREVWSTGEDLSAHEQLLEFLEAAGVGDEADEPLLADLEEPIGAPLVLKPPRLHEGFGEVARELRRRGLKIGLISNTGRTWGRFLRRIQEEAGILDVFDVTVFSDEVRRRKPAREIFNAALETLRVRPEETVHVGDDPEADIRGAQSLGMRAVHCDHSRRLECPFADGRIHDFRELLGVLASW
jgi:putative hydrolase of the HAD superfamily